MHKMGMLVGPCKDTVRNNNTYKISPSINGRKSSFSGMSVPLKRSKDKVRKLLQRLGFTDDSLLDHGVSETLGLTGPHFA